MDSFTVALLTAILTRRVKMKGNIAYTVKVKVKLSL
jgi:hypothetical protein